MTEHDPILEAVRELPSHDVDEWRREHVRLAAHGALDDQPTPLGRFYARVLEPASVCGFGIVYLVWAFGQVATILS